MYEVKIIIQWIKYGRQKSSFIHNVCICVFMTAIKWTNLIKYVDNSNTNNPLNTNTI